VGLVEAKQVYFELVMNTLYYKSIFLLNWKSEVGRPDPTGSPWPNKMAAPRDLLPRPAGECSILWHEA